MPDLFFIFFILDVLYIKRKGSHRLVVIFILFLEKALRYIASESHQTTKNSVKLALNLLPIFEIPSTSFQGSSYLLLVKRCKQLPLGNKKFWIYQEFQNVFLERMNGRNKFILKILLPNSISSCHHSFICYTDSSAMLVQRSCEVSSYSFGCLEA